MSLLINGMDMPKNCESCKHKRFIGTDTNSGLEPKLQYECLFCNDVIITLNGEKNSSCKFEQLPTPHGDLIDRDDLLAYFEKKSKGKTAEEALKLLYTALKAYPTVIGKEIS